jgi:predicted AAA+ superfamily ATPase
MWLKIDDELMFMNGDSVSSLDIMPNKVYKTVFSKMRGTFLKETEIKLEHGVIYGNSQKIADHIVQAYNLSDKTKNLGVLLSGGRGLGKTLTTRLVMEQFKDKYPIVIVSEFTPDLPDFLSNLKNCIILMDEFEKFMSGNANGSDNEDDQTKQETILSVLDGNTGCAGNLFL